MRRPLFPTSCRQTRLQACSRTDWRSQESAAPRDGWKALWEAIYPGPVIHNGMIRGLWCGPPNLRSVVLKRAGQLDEDEQNREDLRAGQWISLAAVLSKGPKRCIDKSSVFWR